MPETQEKRIPILSRLSPPAGAVRNRMRVGRGIGSGKGKTSGQGQKGQKARGTMKKLHFQGGQIPLQRALPKVGFNNIFSVRYAAVNVAELGMFPAGTVIDEALLRDARIVRGRWHGVKVLAGGDIDRAFTVKVDAISATAKEKIEGAGGSVALNDKKPSGPKAKG